MLHIKLFNEKSYDELYSEYQRLTEEERQDEKKYCKKRLDLYPFCSFFFIVIIGICEPMLSSYGNLWKAIAILILLGGALFFGIKSKEYSVRISAINAINSKDNDTLVK